ncbi:MAG: relaxase/mobilization nuclease domain-containing protein [Fusobacteriaceae bacterium]
MALIKSVKSIGKNHSSLKRLINYVGEKTELISGINCSNNYSTIADEFRATKDFYNKNGGRQYKHIIQAFKHNEVTPQKAHEIALELFKSFKGFEVFIATHTDREHIHNHVVINSVNMESGLKFHQSKKDLENLKSLSDKICLDNNLSVIDRTNKSKNISTYDISTFKLLEDVKSNKKNSDIVNLAFKIKDIASKSASKEEFISNLEKDKYSIDWSSTRKHITFTIPDNKLIGKKKKFRLEKINTYFNRDIFTKEGLENEFRRVRAITKQESELIRKSGVITSENTTKQVTSPIRKWKYRAKQRDTDLER